jgi:phosphoenolpyruvate---glycerone phosphotransferase subunit DhaL
VREAVKGIGDNRVSVAYEDVLRWIKAFHSSVEENKAYLTKLDSAIGDADHGTNMARGMNAALTKIEGLEPGDIGVLLKTVGMALVGSVGGAGGPLYGTLFMQMGSASAGAAEVDLARFAEMIDAAVKGVQMRGKAEVGDKTMVDALAPARDVLNEAARNGSSVTEGLAEAVKAAQQGMEATTPLVARKGRASYLGERSAGHQDPGATSSYLLLKTAAEAMTG